MSLSNADRQRRHREKKRKSTVQCPHCGGWIWGEVALQVGFHQRCDRAGYMRKYREIKKGSDREVE